MSVLPRTFAKGFAVEMLAFDAKGTMKNSNSYTLDRNQILDLGNISWTPDEDAYFEFELDTDNLKSYFSEACLYVWTDNSEYPLGAWPGARMQQSGNKYSIKIPKAYIGKKLNFIINNNDRGWQSGNKTMNPVRGTQTYKGADVGLQ